MQAVDCCYTSTTLSGLSQLSAKPVHFFRAVRACVDAAGHWVTISDNACLEMRYTHIFSAVHGFLGVRKLAKISFADTTKCLAMHLWTVVKRIKKFVSAIAWFCKAANDARFIAPQHAAWTSYVKIVHVPMDCISVGFSLVKVSKIAFRWLILQRVTKSEEVRISLLRLQTKAAKELMYCAVKVLDVAYSVLEYFVPSTSIILSLNSLAIAAIRIITVFYATSTGTSVCKTVPNNSNNSINKT